jgi:hypothetical protein
MGSDRIREEPVEETLNIKSLAAVRGASHIIQHLLNSLL